MMIQTKNWLILFLAIDMQRTPVSVYRVLGKCRRIANRERAMPGEGRESPAGAWGCGLAARGASWGGLWKSG
ncbi:hypothetical protein STA1M1_29500 [Sinisalibacter aestuarii]|uniref:ESPR domain-containing protein n=1 Tax=Sinisalibacter aestuarii TaxID=2949426 RepID=A0ABQ5LXT9_9RHOB|nr:hypothetical protein STA1M1_29500 [Sinisalibacter aestuarii]